MKNTTSKILLATFAAMASASPSFAQSVNVTGITSQTSTMNVANVGNNNRLFMSNEQAASQVLNGTGIGHGSATSVTGILNQENQMSGVNLGSSNDLFLKSVQEGNQQLEGFSGFGIPH
jgi:hypothetical protein